MTPTLLIRLDRAKRALAALALGIAVAACQTSGPPPEPKRVPSPVYSWEMPEIAEMPGIDKAPEPSGAEEPPAPPAHASPDADSESPPTQRLQHWRFVPLTRSENPFPSDPEFLEIANRCATAAENGPAGSAEAAPRSDVLSCLGDRGFYPAQCSDGVDNDGDGLSDFGSDPGCAEQHSLSESPECDDDRDNDGDGLADWDGGGFTHPDPECADLPAGNREAAPPSRGSFNPF